MPFEIPNFLQHLPLQQGYPVPYFASKNPTGPGYILHVASMEKLLKALKEHKCWVCGFRVKEIGGYIITGPKGLENNVCTDSWMHERCARFSLEVCPHMNFKKLERRETPEEFAVLAPSYMARAKPDELFLVHTGRYELLQQQGNPLISYEPLAAHRYFYIQGRLVPDEAGMQPLPPRIWQKPHYPRFKL